MQNQQEVRHTRTLMRAEGLHLKFIIFLAYCNCFCICYGQSKHEFLNKLPSINLPVKYNLEFVNKVDSDKIVYIDFDDSLQKVFLTHKGENLIKFGRHNSCNAIKCLGKIDLNDDYILIFLIQTGDSICCNYEKEILACSYDTYGNNISGVRLMKVLECNNLFYCLGEIKKDKKMSITYFNDNGEMKMPSDTLQIIGGNFFIKH